MGPGQPRAAQRPRGRGPPLAALRLCPRPSSSSVSPATLSISSPCARPPSPRISVTARRPG
eukprot:5863549-Alexandrium_andersonii.AAC.1